MGQMNFLKKQFRYFSFFYHYLGIRIFFSLLVSVFVGFLDGIGLALFIPLLNLIANSDSGQAQSAQLDFISQFVIEKLQVTPNLINIFLLILLFFSLKGIAKFLESYLRVVYQQYFMRKLRFSNIDELNNLDFKAFLKSDTGRMHNIFSGEMNRLNMGYVFYFRSVQYTVLVVVYILMSLRSDFVFTIIVLVGGILANLLFQYLFKKTKLLSQKVTKLSNRFQNLLIQQVLFFKYLKSTGLNFSYGIKLKDNISQMETQYKRIGLLDAFLTAIREPMAILIIFIAIFMNLHFFDIAMGAILLSLLLLYRALNYFMTMQEQWNVFLGLSGSFNNMEDFLMELNSGKEKSGLTEFDCFKEKLVLRNVSFSFTTEIETLKNLDLEVSKNETLAIVGESGSGKTTLMNVLSGLLKPSAGDYIIDNISVEELDLFSFRKRLGYIVQDATVFNDTIFNNVTFWAPKTKENLQRFSKAVSEAAIADFISQQPDREDGLLGANGINISGGQKQRLSIARELYKDVDFLFMDEATSALDAETEAAIQQNINKLKGKYTIFIIAHRLSTIKNADRIILMKNGEIKAKGSFAELLESSLDFQEMIKHQNFKQEYSK